MGKPAICYPNKLITAAGCQGLRVEGMPGQGLHLLLEVPETFRTDFKIWKEILVFLVFIIAGQCSSGAADNPYNI